VDRQSCQTQGINAEISSLSIPKGRKNGTMAMKKPIYLDYNATTPHDPEVIKAMTPFLNDHFGNPSSSHWYGMQTKSAVEKAREQVASLLKCNPDGIVFSSGGKESNNYAIKGFAFSHQDKGNHIITSCIKRESYFNAYAVEPWAEEWRR
jgi:cysteine sulfinate desulfinase/cysteine desulfurase-like protein